MGGSFDKEGRKQMDMRLRNDNLESQERHSHRWRDDMTSYMATT